MEATVALRILVIEDDPRMVEVLRRGLWERGHSIVTATTAQEGQDLADTHEFDAILLDLGLPDRSGLTVAAHLRSREVRPAIVMLTALKEEDHVVSGLNFGADDYVSKPFSFPELAARLVSASRRSRLGRNSEIEFGGLTLDTRQYRLRRGQVEVHISRNEYLLLRELALHLGEAVSRRQLMRAVWSTTQVSQGALDTLIGTLRDKLDAERPDLISTARGIGYILQPKVSQ